MSQKEAEFWKKKKTIYFVFCYIDIPRVLNVATPTQDMSVVTIELNETA